MEFAQMASLANSEIAPDEYHPSPLDEPASARKRKAEDGQPAQQRAKRNRYISIACNECKRRKIKCNGQAPCQRCGNLSLECVYAPNCCNGFKDSMEYKDMTGHMDALQEQVNTLYHELNSLRAQLGHGQSMPMQQPQHTPGAIDPSLQSTPFPSHRVSYVPAHASPGAGLGQVSPNMTRPKSQSQADQPSFRGPTSNQFNFGVARSSLQTMGISSAEDGNDEPIMQDPSPDVSPTLREKLASQLLPETHADKDPIWSVSQEEALRLCHVYEDEMGLMYPVLDTNQVIRHAQKLYRFMEAAHRSGLMQQGFPGADSIEDEDTNILKLVLATAMTVEASGRSELGQRMFEYVQPAVDNLLLGNAGTKGLRLLILTAMYEFQRDNEGISWRIVGHTARLCIELGLHRRETYEAISDEHERSETILLFWAIYVLDRRWSFGTGMPFALQDSDIDSQIPKPENRSPYLSAMIQYSAIGAKVWRAVASTSSAPSGGPIDTEEMDRLDFQVLQWHRDVPANLRFEHPSQRAGTPIQPPPSRAGHRLRILLYLRANQMRILIYRPVLHSATSIMQHQKQAQVVVDIALDTIRVLTHINQTSDLYRTQQVLFNAFLTSALAVLFLAVAHTPALFAQNVREEFYMALELVRGFSKGSWIGKRLWKTIRVLKEVGPKLGLAPKDSDPSQAQSQQLDPSRSAAVAMAGLAGHNVDELALMQSNGQGWSGATVASSSPDNMANDLTSLFEAAEAFQALSHGNGSGGVQTEDGVYNASFGDAMGNAAHKEEPAQRKQNTSIAHQRDEQAALVDARSRTLVYALLTERHNNDWPPPAEHHAVPVDSVTHHWQNPAHQASQEQKRSEGSHTQEGRTTDKVSHNRGTANLAPHKVDDIDPFEQEIAVGQAQEQDPNKAAANGGHNRPCLPRGLSKAFEKHCSVDEVARDEELDDMSSSSQAPESWISAFCSLVGHEYFAEVSEDFIEDDFNLTGLQSQVPMYKEALEMILDVEPEDMSDEDDEEDEDEDEDEDEMQDDGLGKGYRRGPDAAERRHLRMHSDLSVIESSAEMLYGLIHQRFITSRSGIQQMAEKYELGHFGHCPRVYCHGAKVLPVGCSDIPGQETVKLFCPACLDVYSPPNSRFQTVDGAFFGTTFGCLFFMTFPDLDVGGARPLPEQQSPAASSSHNINNNGFDKSDRTSLSSSLPSAPQLPPPPLGGNAQQQQPQPESINGVAPKNLAPGLGPGSIYEPRIYGFRVSEVAKTGPRMKWLRGRPTDVNELDECRIWAEGQEVAQLQVDAEMVDDNEEVDVGEVAEEDEEDMGAGAEELPSQPFDLESRELGEVAQRRKPGKRKGQSQSRHGPSLVNGESAGGTAVRVGEGG